MPLIEHFIHHYSRELRKPVKTVSDEARELLVRYDWPGNVRELLNTVERIMILEDGESITPGNLPPEILKRSGNGKRPLVANPADFLEEGTAADYQALTKEFQSGLIHQGPGAKQRQQIRGGPGTRPYPPGPLSPDEAA